VEPRCQHTNTPTAVEFTRIQAPARSVPVVV
jgi:hypothetical protein